MSDLQEQISLYVADKVAAAREEGIQMAQKRITDLERDRDNWMEFAAQMSRNADFYQGIVREIGEGFGVEARTSDDGSIQDDVLALKVPELVAELREAVRWRKWPVEKPNRDTRYLTLDKFGDVECDLYENGKWYSDENVALIEFDHSDEIAGWLPIPEDRK